MNKPSNYENIQTGEFTPPAIGGHHMIIRQLKEEKTKTGKDMLVVLVDFAPNDIQPLYFSKLFEADIRPEKKWPGAGIAYVVSVDNNGQCSRNFKAFITSFEESNGCQVSWGEGPAFCDQFKGKKIGGVYGRVEDEYNGERKLRTKLRYFCTDSRADNAKAPEDKLLPSQPVNAVPTAPAVPDPMPSFTQVNTSELPW